MCPCDPITGYVCSTCLREREERALVLRDFLQPCGCLTNDRGAHRGDCPDYRTIRLVEGTNDPDEMRWERRESQP